MAQLRQEELDVLVGKLAKLVAQHIVNAYVVGISSAEVGGKRSAVRDFFVFVTAVLSYALDARSNIREVRHREERILVKDIALEEPLKQVPRHWLGGVRVVGKDVCEGPVHAFTARGTNSGQRAAGLALGQHGETGRRRALGSVAEDETRSDGGETACSALAQLESGFDVTLG